MTDRAQEDGVEGSQFIDGSFGQDIAGFEVTVAAEIKIFRFVRKAFRLADRVQDLDCFGRHFRSGSISADDGNFHRVAHVRIPVYVVGVEIALKGRF